MGFLNKLFGKGKKRNVDEIRSKIQAILGPLMLKK